MRAIAVCIVAAFTLVGCGGTAKQVESQAPAPVSYPVQNMAEYDAAEAQAWDTCYKKSDLQGVKYVDRTSDSVRFECSPLR
jgi:uncharacterized protein YceK